MKLRCLILAASLMVPAGAALAEGDAVAGAKVRTGPAGAKFYAPPKSLLKGKHGSLIWVRKANKTTTLSSGSSSWVVLYRSVSTKGKPIAVSGLVTLPKGKAPKGGWGVVSWSHGTTGIADVCAPSRDTPSGPAHPYIDYVDPQLNAMLAQKYAVVRSDFEGLGTAGPHPYLVGVSEGRGSVDIIRAARELNKGVGTKWVSAGHSQGGQAALFAGSIARKWAPELKLKGVAAFAPASHIGTIVSLAKNFHAPGGSLSGTGSLFLVGAAAGAPSVELASILGPAAKALVPDVDRKCLGGLSAADSWGGLAPADLLRPDADLTALNTVLADNEPSALKLTVPVLLLQGDADAAVFKSFTDLLDASLKGNGASVDYKIYAGAGHYPLLAAAEPDAVAWLQERLG